MHYTQMNIFDLDFQYNQYIQTTFFFQDLHLENERRKVYSQVVTRIVESMRAFLFVMLQFIITKYQITAENYLCFVSFPQSNFGVSFIVGRTVLGLF